MKRELLFILAGCVLGGLTSFLGVSLSPAASQLKTGQAEIAAAEITVHAAVPKGPGWEVVAIPLLVAFLLALGSFAVARNRATNR